MAKVRRCPDCECVMRHTGWKFDDAVGGEKGTAEFDCRNCDFVSNNDDFDQYFGIPGFSEEIFENIPSDMSFDEFLQHYEDRITSHSSDELTR